MRGVNVLWMRRRGSAWVGIALYSCLVATVVLATGPSNAEFASNQGASAEGPTVAQRLEAAQVQATFPKPSTDPFRLQARLEVRNGDATLSGTYTWIWQSPTQFRTNLRLQDFQEIRLVQHDTVTWLRNMGYAPRTVVELMAVLDFVDELKLDAPSKASPLKERTVEGVPSLCSHIRRPPSAQSLKVVCFDPQDGRLRFLERQDGRTLAFGTWRAVGDSWLPSWMERTVGKDISIRVDFDPVEPLEAVDPAIWTLDDPRAKTWGWCPEDQYEPPRPKQKLPNLGVNVHLELDRQGKFTSVFVIGRGGTYQSAKLHKKVRAIRFEPATCNGTPVESEFFISQGTQP